MLSMSNGECRTARTIPYTQAFPVALALLFLAFQGVNAQTSCGVEHPATGVFICYPNPSENDADATVPDVFHLSAQANAPEGQAIAAYSVSLDNRTIYRMDLAVPISNLSIEKNLKSPFPSGVHTLRLIVPGAGTAEVKRVQLQHAENTTLCDPFSRIFARACTVLNLSGKLSWSPKENNKSSANDPLQLYSAYSTLYNQNLKSIEADTADAVATDRRANLYAAFHAFSGVDLRKYSGNGSLLYSSVIPMCGDAFVSVVGLAVDDAGRAWIAGNTNGCSGTAATSPPIDLLDAGRMRGFVMVVDTSKPGSVPPPNLMYLSDVENRIAAIRISSEGEVYIAGNTSSGNFRHDTSLTVGQGSSQRRELNFGFVAELNSSQPELLWSTLLPNTFVSALAVDEAANIYLTGHMASHHPSSSVSTDVVVAELSDRGRRLSFAALFGGSGDEEGRAISTAAHGNWILVTGATNSVDFPGFARPNTKVADPLKSFWAALRPCGTAALHSQGLANEDINIAPQIVQTPALDAFAGEVDPSALEQIKGSGDAARVFVVTGPTCSSAIR
jgi:hypothetical protein